MTDPETDATTPADRDADADANSNGSSSLDAASDQAADGPTDADSGPDTDESPVLLVTERPTPEGLLVSVCDETLLGASLSTPDGEVSIEVTETFYGGEPRDSAATADALGRADVANLVGTRAVSLAVEVGLVDPANVLDLDGTPHAQYMQL